MILLNEANFFRQHLPKTLNLMVLLLWFTGIESLWAQEGSFFSQNSEAFINEIAAELQQTNNRNQLRQANDLMDELVPIWNHGRFTEAEKDGIKMIANLITEQKLLPFPHLYDFMVLVNHFAKSRQHSESITAWNRYAIALLEMGENRKFSDNVSFTSNLLDKEVLSKQGAINWYARKARYSFEADSILKVRFESIDLVGATARDSTKIHQTAGVFTPAYNTWQGEGGNLFWSRFNLDKKAVNITFTNYKINLDNAEYTADSVVFRNTNYFDIPLLGSLHEKVFSSPPGSRTSFPRFRSYLKKHRLNAIFESINFIGGISMEGGNFIGSGSDDGLAVLEFHYNNQLTSVIRAKTLQISKDRLIAESAAAAFYIENDSIYHPGVRLQYTDDNRLLVLSRSERGISDAPFLAFYHKFNMYVEALYWSIDTPEIHFWRIKGPGDESYAKFESFGYFFEPAFRQMQGIDELHPMFVLQDYIGQFHSDENIRIADLAHYMRKPEEQVIAQMLRLASKGYVVYNSINRSAILTDRFFHALGARAGKEDFDQIEIESNTKARIPNAVLNIETFDLQMNGVDEIELSSPNKVKVFPKSGTLKVSKNRDFSFSGLIAAGLFRFYSQESNFHYDSFLVRMTQVDSMMFFVPERTISTDAPRRNYVKVSNYLTDLNGTLFIDDPSNKSGILNNPWYPVFESADESYVFFDSPRIQSGTLDSDKFYFVADPFVIDSLSDTEAHLREFDGYLSSAGIFPTFRQPLQVMEDYSLGFNHHAPPEGYKMYADKATYFDSVHLSDQGFFGKGQLDFLTTSSLSEKYTFYPDSVVALLNEFTISGQIAAVEFPNAKGEGLEMLWLSDTNNMFINTLDNPLLIYDEAMFRGEAQLSPSGMAAKGLLLFGDSELESEWFKFDNSALLADTAVFRLLTADAKQNAFLASNYLAELDFKARQGIFNHIDNSSLLSFPFNQYMCTLDEAIWEMDGEVVKLNNNRIRNNFGLDTLNYFQLMDIDLSGSEFTSTHPEQEALSFFSLSADYDMRNYVIRAKDVKIIRLADAAVFPVDGLITIVENARIEPLLNAFVIADTLTRFHQFEATFLDIDSRNSFNGYGYYDYIDSEKNTQVIALNSINVEDNRTVATGEILESANFFLNPYFAFMGKVELRSARKHLEFSGGYKLVSDCININQAWTAFTSPIDPFNLILPLPKESMDLSGMRLYSGLFYNPDTDAVYSVLQQYKRSANDFSIYSPHGLIWFNPDNKAFEVVNEINGRKQVVQNLTTTRCIAEGNGIFDLGMNMPFVDMLLAGSFEHWLIPDSTYLDVTVSLDFPFSEELMDILGDSLVVSQTAGLNLNRSNYFEVLTQLLPVEQTDRIRSEVALYGAPRTVPTPFDRTITLVDLQMRWNPETRSYVSFGPIGVSNLQNNQINKYVSGFVEIEKARNRYGFSMYLQLGKEQWYFFTYNNGIMQALSSSNEFNTALLAIDQARRSFENKENNQSYEYVISTRRRVTDFIRMMQRIEF